jgi:hypothetical protein
MVTITGTSLLALPATIPILGFVQPVSPWAVARAGGRAGAWLLYLIDAQLTQRLG